MSTTTEVEQLRSEWFQRLNDLIDTIEGWVKELDWATRRIEVTLDEEPFGKYKAPALLMQENAFRVILEPLSHRPVGGDGLADLYQMPAWDDIARFVHSDGSWKISFAFPDAPVVDGIRDSIWKPLTKEAFIEALSAMQQNAE